MKPTILADAGAIDPVILEVRSRFVADFPMRCDAAATCIEATRMPAKRAAAAQSLRAMAHRIAGLAGVVGFSRVGALASDLEDVAAGLESGAVEPAAAHIVLESLRTAFTQELSGADAAGTPSAAGAVRGDILLAEDDPDQRAIVSAYLAHAGYTVHAVEAGHLVGAAARATTPSVVLLDVEMPGLDGYSVCRELKADPDLSTVPVVFMTSRARLDDRLAGLALGADDYLVKPVDPRELVIRLERVQVRDTARAEGTAAGGVLSYEDFVAVARNRLSRAACALVLMRAAAERLPQVLVRVRDEIRRADLAASFDRTHLVLLLPDVTGAAARSRVAEIVQGLHDRGFDGVSAGVAAAPAAGSATLQSLLAAADEALAQARCYGRLAALAGELTAAPAAAGARTVLVADDDPDVTRILDAQFRAAGYETTLTFDGAAAMEAIERRCPDVVLLDLMMPDVSGFEVLGRLQRADRRPKVLVLSARGREDDVTRAFELGADDYVVKPFNPQELLARVARLLR